MAISKLWSIGEAGGKNPSASLYRSLVYITDQAKTDGGRLVGGSLCIPTALEAYKTMIHTKQVWDKTKERQGYHIVISFPPEENVTSDTALIIARQFAERYLKCRYEALYSIHTDQKHMHIHMIFNSVSAVDGLKYHYNNGDWRRYIQPVVNEICAEHGLSTLDLSNPTFTENMEKTVIDKALVRGKRLSKEEWLEQKAGLHTWAEFIAADIDSILPTANCYEDVIRGLKNIGWQVKWKTKDGSAYLKHYAVQPPKWICEKEQNMAWHRPDTKCGYGYSREGLELRIKYGIWDIEEIEMPEESSFGRYSRLKVVGVQSKNGTFRRTMTDYQRRYFAMLYRTGQMNRRKANQIPMEWRTEVRQINETKRMVEYLMREGLETEEQVRERLEGLRLRLMKAEKSDEKNTIVAIKEKIIVCEEILGKETLTRKGRKEPVGPILEVR